MQRLSIEVTPEQHKRLKAVAALQGKSIKEYVLERVLPPLPEMDSMSEEEAISRLEEFLKPRIEGARRGEFATRSVEQIFEDVRQES
ncbi:MAG: antitoxin [Candidatus Nitronauta litoralis]|uniref:Antitoxin n=1 Tax=Candidatus Nitronauta litoralis TaxID=2705533 RepID=A0A7T0BWG3_9BACT|nr:MAG: antitoxin [Candidatus Nitronauta litoralis]